jgi:hypothetical protein
MKTKHYVPIVLVVIFTSILIPGVAMGFRPFQICMFSEVNAVVTLHGKPVTGAKIVRTSNELDSKVYTEQTTTDAQGRFHFDALWVFSLRHLIPAQPMVEQHITIYHAGKEYMGWQHTKNGYGHNDELDHNKPLAFTCELGDEPTLKYQMMGNVEGICKW